MARTDPSPPRPPEPSRPTRALAALTAALLRRRGLALAGVVAVVLVAALGLLRLRVDFSSAAFYGDGSAAAERFAGFQARWGADDDTLLVLIRPTADDDPGGVVTPERLAAIAELGRDLAAAEGVVRVRSIADLPPGWTGLERASLAIVPAMLAADGQATVLAVELGFSTDDVLRTQAAVDALSPTLAAYDPRLRAAGLTRELAGIPAIRAGFVELLVRDQALFVPLSLALIGLALALVFRRVHGVVIPAAAAATATVILVGLMAWLGEPVGLLNQAYFTLLPVLIVADAIHLVARYHEELDGPASAAELDPAAPGHDLDHRGRAIVRAASQVGLACLLTSVTTAVGFASLAVAQMPILRSFGLYAALGIGLGFAIVMILVPVLLSFVPGDRPPIALPGLGPVDALLGAALARPRLVVAASLVVAGLALIPARAVRIDNTLTGLLDEDHPTSVASRRVDAELGGVLGLELELHARPGGASEDLRDPAALARVYALERWLAGQPEVRSVIGPATLLAAAPTLLGLPAELPETRAAIDARLAAVAAGGAPIDRYLAADGRSLRITAGLPDAGGQAFVAFAAAAEDHLRTELDGAGIEVHATGTPLLAYAGVNRITADLRTSFALVFVVVLVVFALLFRSPWPALIGLLPNGLPLLLGYATVGLAGEVLDPLAAVILTLALGVAVDDTVHVMVRTREELARGAPVEQAIRRAVAHSGRAVAVTSVVIAGGLAINLLSSFPPLRMLGLLGAVVLSLALLADLLVLPALLALLRGRGLTAGVAGRRRRPPEARGRGWTGRSE